MVGESASFGEQKGLTQVDIEKASGLLRCYVSRVEGGHTVPSLETLERFAAALDVPLYRLFYTGEDAPATPHLADEAGPSGTEAPFLLKLKWMAKKMVESDRVKLRDLLRQGSPASEDANLAFGTLARLFSKL